MLGWLVIVLIVFVAGGCLPNPAPHLTDTPTTSPTSSSRLADIIAPTPAVGTEMGSLTKAETLDVPLGIGIYNLENVALFNRYAREQDVIAARPEFLELLEHVEIGQKMLVVGPHDTESTDIASLITEAKAKGVTLLGYNLETALSKDELIGKEKEMQAAAAVNRLSYAFAPTLRKLLKHYDDFARHADIIVLQSQRFQTTEDYEESVEELAARIKSTNPAVDVWVQVSVNPPEKRDVTPDEVLMDVQLVADKADLVWIYFGPQTSPVMGEVFRLLRQ
jgi:hypothetical protein